VTIVWIAAHFVDEHRAALDWLNDVTGEDINFFGLEIELWRIGDSPVAPKFNIVSKPNDWTKIITGSRSGPREELTDTKELQLEYWRAFSKLASEKSNMIRPRKPRPQHWMNFAIGRSKFKLTAFANVRDQRIGVGLTLTGSNAKPHFYLLEDEMEAIETEIGAKLDWREMLDKKSSRIYLIRYDTDPQNRSEWSEQHEWLLEKLEAFHMAFADRVKQLDATEYEPEDEEMA
jgi:hypothetical protein